jgi:ATPase subunit of ABC transporter with duplicated ATPase domains
MRQRHNLLLLDEPTNHLDLDSREALEESLEDFPGSIVFVSHDRAFIDRLATRVLDIRDGRPLLLDGNYSETAQARAERRSRPEPAEGERRGDAARAPLQMAASRRASRPRTSPTAEPAAAREAARRRRRIQALEEKVANLEKEVEALETRLWEEGLTLGPVASRDLARQRAERQSELDSLVEEWARLSEEEARATAPGSGG